MTYIKKITDSQEELLTEVDINNKVLGSISRKVAHHSPDKYYRTLYVLVKDRKGRVLLQKRSFTKDLYPNCWDLSVGGHVGYGLTYLEAAVREVKEELGLTIPDKDLKLIGKAIVKLPNSNEIFQVFEYKIKTNEHLRISKEEIMSTQWMTICDIKKSIKNRSLKWYPRPIQIINALY